MGFPSPHVWRKLGRSIEIQSDARAVLGSVLGVLRGNGERELEGGASLYAASLVVPKRELDAAGITELRPFMHVRDPLTGSLFSVASVRLSVMRGSVLVKAELEGLQ